MSEQVMEVKHLLDEMLEADKGAEAFEILLPIRAIAPYGSATAANLRHMRRLMEFARPTYVKTGEVVDKANDAAKGKGGT